MLCGKCTCASCGFTHACPTDNPDPCHPAACALLPELVTYSHVLFSPAAAQTPTATPKDEPVMSYPLPGLPCTHLFPELVNILSRLALSRCSCFFRVGACLAPHCVQLRPRCRHLRHHLRLSSSSCILSLLTLTAGCQHGTEHSAEQDSAVKAVNVLRYQLQTLADRHPIQIAAVVCDDARGWQAAAYALCIPAQVLLLCVLPAAWRLRMCTSTPSSALFNHDAAYL